MDRTVGCWTGWGHSVDSRTMKTVQEKSHLMIGGVIVLLLVGVSWFMATREASAESVSSLVGRDWSSASSVLGFPACRAAGYELTARESAARRAEGESALVVPHAELMLIDPGAVQGRGSRVSSRVLVFTDDATIRTFLDRHASGDLQDTRTETRIAIERPGTVRVVELDSRERIVSIREIRPVFLTVRKR